MRVLICGRWRTGKTVLRDILNTCPGVFITNESRMFDFAYKAKCVNEYVNLMRKRPAAFAPLGIHRIRNRGEYVDNLSWPNIVKRDMFNGYGVWGDKSNFYYNRYGTPLQMYQDGLIDIAIYVQRSLAGVLHADRAMKSKTTTVWSEEMEASYTDTWQKSMDSWAKMKDKLPSLTVDFEDLEAKPVELACALGKALEIQRASILNGISQIYDSNKA